MFWFAVVVVEFQISDSSGFSEQAYSDDFGVEEDRNLVADG
jgi:hypothetical protein